VSAETEKVDSIGLYIAWHVNWQFGLGVRALSILTKLKACIALNGKPIWAMGCHLTHGISQCTRHEWTRPALTPASWYLIHLSWRDGRLSWPRLVPGNAPARSRELATSRSKVRCPNYYTTEPRGYSTSSWVSTEIGDHLCAYHLGPWYLTKPPRGTRWLNVELSFPKSKSILSLKCQSLSNKNSTAQSALYSDFWRWL